MKELIEKLESAIEGGHELDWEIALIVSGRKIAERQRFATETLPHYTTSLDAKIPGENIVGMGFSTKAGKYWALHDGTNKGAGVGHTEILARCIAGLKGMDAKEVKEKEDES